MERPQQTLTSSRNKKLMWPLHRAGATRKGKRRLVVIKIVTRLTTGGQSRCDRLDCGYSLPCVLVVLL